ncbi:MAG: hypothetical protein E6I60_02550 [Chloroflexi bacterium]|nr:MAG: hypothetical protein E6I60_02550 [Chloroflexota bacterium]
MSPAWAMDWATNPSWISWLSKASWLRALNSPVAVRVPTAPIASVSAAKGSTIFNASRWLKRGMMTGM